MTMIYRGYYPAMIILPCALASCGVVGDQPDPGPTASTPDAVATQVKQPALSDHPWHLTVIDRVDAEDFEPAVGSEPIVMFSVEANPTGSRLMNGSTGCNRFNATYDAGRGGRLVIGSATMTRMACASDVMRLEQVFMIGLESARTYTIADKGLAIDFDGGVLHFRANDAGG